jgi:Fungal specific transcription factor domain
MIMAIAARVRPPSQYHYPGITPSHYPLAYATPKSKPNANSPEVPARPPSRISHDQFYSRMLPYFSELLHEPELSDLQALLLVMVYLIGIYKMGHLWHLSRLISAVAFELGLHRSDANWSNFNPLEREMRKRVFFLTVGLDLKVAKYRTLSILIDCLVHWEDLLRSGYRIRTCHFRPIWTMNILMKAERGRCQKDRYRN